MRIRSRLSEKFEMASRAKKQPEGRTTRRRRKNAARRKKTKRDMPDLDGSPLWVLNADRDFLSRKLDSVGKRKEKGEPAHKKYRNYESKLKERLSELDVEIKRRQEV